MLRVLDPVFAMAESFFLDGGSRLDDVEENALAHVSAWRSVADPNAKLPDVGRCRIGYAPVSRARRTDQSGPGVRRQDLPDRLS